MAMDMERITIEAPAKINLFLRVVGRRPDGYHELDSLMAKLALADTVTIEKRPAPGIEVSCPGVDLPEDEGNIAWRAAAAVAAEAGSDVGVRVTIDKRIPVAAGLGGGSSDAAATLVGMNRLFGFGIGRERLLEIAVGLGADVPFFVCPWPVARAAGIGEKLAPVSLDRPYHVVLINPGFRVSTRWVFENFALTSAGDPYMLGRNETDGYRGATRLASRHFHNDLERVTIKKYPELRRIKTALLDAGAEAALMSGSGPTVFGLFGEEDRARRCCRVLAGRYPWVFCTAIRAAD